MNQSSNKLMDDVKEGSYNKSFFDTVHFAYEPYKNSIFISLILGFTGRGLLLANTNIIGYWADQFCKPTDTVKCRAVPLLIQGLTPQHFLIILSIMTFLGFIFTIFYRFNFSRYSALAVSQLYDETTIRASRFPSLFFDITPLGKVITRFSSDYNSVFRLLGGAFSEFLSIIFDLIWIVILIALASPLYLPILSLVVFLNYFVWKKNRYEIRQARRKLSASRSPSISLFSETANGSICIRSLFKEKIFTERFKFLDKIYLAHRLEVSKKLIFFSLGMNFLTALLFIMTGILALFFVKTGILSFGSVGVAFAFITLSGNTVQNFFEWLTQVEEALIGVERLNDYIHSPIEEGSKLPSERQFATPHPVYTKEEEVQIQKDSFNQSLSASIDFKDIWFRYDENLPFVLKGINFNIHHGERFGIIGRTGSGKTSLIQALFYFYPLTKGKILINGLYPKIKDKDQMGIDLELYRKAIAYIPQDPILFKGSIKDNLDIFGQKSNEELINTLSYVGLQNWASEEGLNRNIEEKANNLSVGEKQLFCLARCLLAASPVIIMDEATSSVDPKSEEVIVHATEQFFQGRTQIIIAHRLSTLKKCDRILWLENGEIKRLGPSEEVLKEFVNSTFSQVV